MAIDAKGVLGGLFGGNSNILLPMNPLIQDYGMSEGKTFKMNIRAFQPKPISLTPGDEGMNVEKGINEEILVFDVFYATDSITVNHSHSWGDSVQGGLVRTAAQMAGKVGMASIANMAGGMVSGKHIISGIVRQDSWMDVDVAPIYQGTVPQKLDITFYLIAHDDPIKEVVIPAQIITYLTYPKLQYDNSVFKLIDTYMKKLEGKTGELLNQATGGILKDLQGNNSIPDWLKDFLLTIIQTYGRVGGQFVDQIKSSFRWRFGSPPPIWQIASSNGSIFLLNAHVSNLSVTYHGPWLGSKSQAGLLQDLIKAGTGAATGLGPMMNVFPSSSVFGLGEGAKGLLDIMTKTNKGGYPSYAEITISFESNFTSVFGEEWLLSLNPSVVTVK